MPGHIITFYSYKGGTGRSMALCSVAALLARRSEKNKGRGVLVVDWDLEAPGLHRFFRDHLPDVARPPCLDRALESRPGLIDLFEEIGSAIPDAKPASRSAASQSSKTAVDALRLDQFVLPTNVPGLSLMTAGRFDSRYSSRVNQFAWENLYLRAPRVYLDLAERWSEKYDYVLIDSRTGLTDISGICTMLLPEKLVVVFTPNRQSLTGISGLVRRAIDYRKNSDDLRPLIVFPLASRVENAEPTLKNVWRFGDPSNDLEGFQPAFESLLKEAYQLDACYLSQYFQEVMIQHVPRYAYGESIAVLSESEPSGTERLSLSRSYEDFTDRLIYLQGPWEDWSTGQSRKTSEEADRTCELAFQKADLHRDDRLLAALTRLVRVAQQTETVPDQAASAPLRDFPTDLIPSLRQLAAAGLLVIGTDTTAQETLTFASGNMVRDWDRLRERVEQDREFLQWRQRLDAAFEESKRSGHELAARLSGTRLTEALDWLARRPTDLSQDETWYIHASGNMGGHSPKLEAPFSPVAYGSPVYLSRKAELAAMDALKRNGVTLLIIGPRGSGKTSLLNRIIGESESAGKRVALIDFTALSSSVSTFAEVLGWMTTELRDALLLAEPPDIDDFVSVQRFTRFIEGEVLPWHEQLVLAFDEAEKLGDLLPEFLSMIRQWENRRNHKARWSKLTIVFTTTLEPSLYFQGNHSPFNVGLRIMLEPFGPSDVAELNRIYGSPLNATDVQRLVDLVGGAPDLVRRALYAVTSGQVDPETLFQNALNENGVFGDKLLQLGTNKALTQALANVDASVPDDDSEIIASLMRNGYVSFREGKIRATGRLFVDYVRKIRSSV